MTAMLENNNEDKMEAIDSLREEYEEHCRNAVEQTKRLVYFYYNGKAEKELRYKDSCRLLQTFF